MCPEQGKLNAKTRPTKRALGTGDSAQFWGCPDYPNCRGVLPYVSKNSTNLIFGKDVVGLD